MSVSEKLRTYLSPNPTTVDGQQVKVNVGLGEGKVWSYSDTDIELIPLKIASKNEQFIVKENSYCKMTWRSSSVYEKTGRNDVLELFRLHVFSFLWLEVK